MGYFLSLDDNFSDTQVIKNSKFIGNIYPISSVEQAQEILGILKKQYWDASHNCYAYIFGRNQEILKSSDDGEPQGTAGMPILEAIKNAGLTNVLVVVTRYFGGTLLGKSGLIRAYSSTASLAIEASQIIKNIEMNEYSFEIPFTLYGKVMFYFEKQGFTLFETEYTDNVKINIHMEEKDYAGFEKNLMEISSGKISIKYIGSGYVKQKI